MTAHSSVTRGQILSVVGNLLEIGQEGDLRRHIARENYLHSSTILKEVLTLNIKISLARYLLKVGQHAPDGKMQVDDSF